MTQANTAVCPHRRSLAVGSATTTTQHHHYERPNSANNHKKTATVSMCVTVRCQSAVALGWGGGIGVARFVVLVISALGASTALRGAV